MFGSCLILLSWLLSFFHNFWFARYSSRVHGSLPSEKWQVYVAPALDFGAVGIGVLGFFATRGVELPGADGCAGRFAVAELGVPDEVAPAVDVADPDELGALAELDELDEPDVFETADEDEPDEEPEEEADDVEELEGDELVEEDVAELALLTAGLLDEAASSEPLPHAVSSMDVPRVNEMSVRRIGRRIGSPTNL